MKKVIVLIIIFNLVLSGVLVNAEPDEAYAIQLGVFKNESFADRYVEQLKNKGLNPYKISTSIHSIFYDIYPSREEAIKELTSARKYVAGAHVVKLSDKQLAVYLKGIAPENASISDPNNTNLNTEDKLNVEFSEEKKQITINKTPEGNLEYMYRVVNDIELRGINGESKWFFNVEKGLKVKDFTFNLFSRVNELIIMDISYFTVYMNDLPIKSMKMKNDKNELLSSWQIEIPTDLIKEGYNELKVLSHSRITDNPCEDDKNIANWVIIDGNTNYVITYDSRIPSGDISDFPWPFISMLADDSKGVGVVVPDNYSDKEISAALTLIAHMKSDGIFYDVPSTLVTTSDKSLLDFDSLIYIGNYQSVPQNLKSTIKNQEELYTENVHLYESTFGNDKKPVLMIVSDQGEQLIEAVKALNNNDVKEQMVGNYIMLNSNLNATIKEEKAEEYIYLRDLGINGIEVKGSNRQVANIGIRIPSNQMLANESNINLRLRYSDNLDYEKSMVSVYVNGIPVGSQKLDREKRDLYSLTFYMPEALRRNTYYDVRIVFELIPSGIIDCERYLSSVPWAYIIEDSNYFFPKQERNLMLLNNLPFPFSRNDDLDSTIIIAPDHLKTEDYLIATKLAELAGIGIKNNKGTIELIKGSTFNEKHHEKNLIIFGTPNENSVFKIINNSLWFQYNSQFNKVLSNEKMELLPETSTSATFFELKVSPYDDEKGMMTITSLDKQSIIKAVDYLKDNKRGYLTGDAAIISKSGNLSNIRFQKDDVDERPFIHTTEKLTKNTKNYIIFTGILVLFLIISLSFYAMKNRRRKK